MSAQCVRDFKSTRVSTAGSILLPLIMGALGVVLLHSVLDATTTTSVPPGENALNNLGHKTSVSTAAPTTPAVDITKTIVPPNPHTGEVVSICFTIKRPKLDVVLVHDVSGSMAGEKLTDSQAAAITFVTQLQSTDRGAVVSYSTIARLAQPLTTTKSSITRTISELTATGLTNIGEGISVAHKELITHSPRSGAVKAIILLSDGAANCPQNDPKGYALDRARKAASDTIKIYTIGFGHKFSETLLISIADIGNGEFHSALNLSDLETVYLTIALELHNLVITDILTPGVEGPGGVTTVTLPFSDSLLKSNPLTHCFAVTVNLDPNYRGLINDPDSDFCYYPDSSSQPICDAFDNPSIAVGGRKITGRAFYDLNLNGQKDDGEKSVAGKIVRAMEWITWSTTTSASGNYVLRIPSEPAILVTIDVSPNHAVTPLIPRYIPPITGTYTENFGIYIPVFLPIIVRNYAPPSLYLSQKEVSEEMARPGDTLLYTITLINSGTTEPISAAVIDAIPSNSTYITGSVTGGGSFRDNQIHWTVTLPAEVTHVVEFKAQVHYTCPTTIINEAKIQEDTEIERSRMVTTQIPCLKNGSFEDGWTGWTDDGILREFVTSTIVHTGQFSVLLGDPAYKCDGRVPVGEARIQQKRVFVPPTNSPKLHFWYRIFTQDKKTASSEKFDSFDVKINGHELVFQDANITAPKGCDLPSLIGFGWQANDLGWREGKVDLFVPGVYDYRGQFITVTFKNSNQPHGWYNTWTFVDDVKIIP
jgi:uncharacterized repeat protein (TIGR01451 family)